MLAPIGSEVKPHIMPFCRNLDFFGFLIRSFLKSSSGRTSVCPDGIGTPFAVKRHGAAGADGARCRQFSKASTQRRRRGRWPGTRQCRNPRRRTPGDAWRARPAFRDSPSGKTRGGLWVRSAVGKVPAARRNQDAINKEALEMGKKKACEKNAPKEKSKKCCKK